MVKSKDFKLLINRRSTCVSQHIPWGYEQWGLEDPTRAIDWGAGHTCMLRCVRLFATPWAVTHQVPLSMRCSRQEYWSGLPFPPSGDLPDPVILRWQADSLPLSHQGAGYPNLIPWADHLSICFPDGDKQEQSLWRPFLVPQYSLEILPFLSLCILVVGSTEPWIHIQELLFSAAPWGVLEFVALTVELAGMPPPPSSPLYFRFLGFCPYKLSLEVPGQATRQSLQGEWELSLTLSPNQRETLLSAVYVVYSCVPWRNGTRDK